MKSKWKMSGIVIMALLSVCLLSSLWSGSSNEQTATQTGPRFDYPEHWSGLGLPEIHNGQVISPGKGNLHREGFYFDLQVDQSPHQVGIFFEEELHKRWFEFFVSNLSDEGRYSNDFSAGSLEVTIDAWPAPDDSGNSKVRIGMKQKQHPAASTPPALSSVLVE